MIRRLFWLSAVAGVGYLAWRWFRQQNEEASPAGYVPPAPVERLTASPTSTATPVSPAGSSTPAASTAPRRIVTRVHRGAPPAASSKAPSTASAEEPASPADAEPAAPPDLADLADLVAPEAAAPPDLADLVAPEAAAPPDLADLADLPPPEQVDLSHLVGELAEAGAPSLDAPLTSINTADEATLIALPGIGPALARRIITYREEYGPFTSVDQLADIQGIGPRNIDEFRHLVTL